MVDRSRDLYRLAEDQPELDRPVLVHALSGFVDAGQAGGIAVEHLLSHLQNRVLATFDADELVDYRSRRPVMTFDGDRWSDYDRPELELRQVVDEAGTPFLLLAGPEPDLRWEQFAENVVGLVEHYGVRLTVGLTAVPMTVPHTRPVTVTPHATRPELIEGYQRWFGRLEVPGSAAALLELRLGEAGHDALGFAVHVPHYLTRTAFPDSARGLLENLIRSSGLILPTDALSAAAAQVLEQVDEQVTHSDEVAAVVRTLEERYDEAVGSQGMPPMSGMTADDLPSADELGAELEQFLADRRRGEGGPNA